MEKQKGSEKMGRRYDRDFKRDAVALVQSGKTITEVARGLGVAPWSISRWLAEVKAGGTLKEPSTLAAETPEQRELRRLRQENAHLERQRDILKKALAIVSGETPSSDSRS